MEQEPQPQTDIEVLIDALHHDNPSWQQTVALKRIGLSNNELSWMLDSDIELHIESTSERLMELSRLAAEALRIIQDIEGVCAWFRAPIREHDDLSPVEIFSTASNNRFVTPVAIKSALLGVTPYLLNGSEQKVSEELLVWSRSEVIPRLAQVVDISSFRTKS